MALVASLTSWDGSSTSAAGAKRYQELAKAMSIARAYLQPRDIGNSRSPSRPGKFLVFPGGQDLYHDFLEMVDARYHLVKRDIQRFTNCLQVFLMLILPLKPQETAAISVLPQTDQIMVDFLDRLALWQRIWGIPIRAFNDPKLISNFTSAFHGHLHAVLPQSFPTHLQAFLSSSLSSLPSHLLDPPPPPQLLSSVPINPQRVPPRSPHLSRLGFLPRYSGILSKVAYDEIERIAIDEAGKGWDGRRLTRARQRVGNGVANWLSGMFEGNEPAQAALRPMFSRFDYYLCKCFFEIRTNELFDIIVDYPDSLAALEDLKECLYKVDQRSTLVDKLKASNVKRLLHPGAETKDVISQYISSIRCLRILDPPGVLLHKVADPIRRHLRDRSDTIKCIVATLVEEEDLQDENEASGGLISQSNDEAVENFLDPRWDPEPVDAAPEFRSGKASDIISTLVSIYESREAIIKELQVLLATRLLSVKDYDAVQEIRTIELLKIRFGETALQMCDVMLKDMADSKRIDDHVHGDIQSAVHPLVISRMFWPSIPPSSFTLPPKLQKQVTPHLPVLNPDTREHSAQRDYESAFHHFKPDKRLRWLQHIGTATVRLELSDRAVEIEATPIQAAIAELLEERPAWTAAELGERLSFPDQAQMRIALAFWEAHGVVKEDVGRGEWGLLEYAEEGAAQG